MDEGGGVDEVDAAGVEEIKNWRRFRKKWGFSGCAIQWAYLDAFQSVAFSMVIPSTAASHANTV